MLVLTRKQKEVIKIGDSITITILRVQGQAVRVGIEAPQDVRVVRGELAAKQAASREVAGPEDVSPVATGDESLSDAEEPQVVQFRFSATPDGTVASPRRDRGPLAALMATLHSPGFMADAVLK